MALTTPRIPYLTIRDNIVTILQNALAALNTNLTEALVTADIKAGDPTVEPVSLDKVPAVYVRFEGKPEESFQTLGATRKALRFQYRIFGLTKRGTSTKLADDEMTLLGRNIEGVFRDNVQLILSSAKNVLYCNPANLELSIGVGDKSFFGMVTVLLDCWYTAE